MTIVKYLRALAYFPIGVFIILGMIVVGVFLIINRSDLELSKAEINKQTERDTVEAYPEQGLYLINIIDNGSFGRFSLNYAVVKNLNAGKKIVYKLPKPGNNEGNRTSGDYILFVNFKEDKVINKYNKRQIFKVVDSVSKLSDPPETIIFKAVN